MKLAFHKMVQMPKNANTIYNNTLKFNYFCWLMCLPHMCFTARYGLTIPKC